MQEKFLGLCYKKCSIITNGEFPYRITPVTCCETKGIKCLHPKRTSWNFAHATGGGENDDDPLTPARPHAPITLRRTQTSTFTPAQVAPPEPEFGPVPETTTPSPYAHDPGALTIDSPPVTTSTIEFLMPAPTPAPLVATTTVAEIAVPSPAPEIVTTTVAALPFEVPTLPVAPTPAPGDASA